MRIFRIIAILLLVPFLASGQLSDLQRSQLDSIFMDWKPDTPGGVACVVQQGNIIFKKSSGLADLEKKIPNSFDLKYDLASNAKQFTAMCIALLEEQGKLSTEDNLKKYYPGLKINQEIKIKNLIDHTSGLRDASVLAVLSGKMNLKGEVRKAYETKEYYLECFLRETDLNYPVGSEFAYTNFNYVLLADLVEKVSGQRLSVFLDSAIFKPLGMTHTVLRDKRDMKIENEASGYRFVKNKFKKQVALGGIVGDHNMLSTIDDLARWENNFFHNQLGNRDPKLIDKVCTSSTLNNGSLTRYGYGLWVTQHNGAKEIGHGGDDGRHTSRLIHFPDLQLAVIVLANSSRYNDTEGKAFQIADVFLKTGKKEPGQKPEDFTFISLPENELKSHVGLYTQVDERGLGKLLKISFAEGSLYGSRNYFMRGLKLSPISPNTFAATISDGRTVKVEFTETAGQKAATETFGDKSRNFVLRKDEPIAYRDYKGLYKNESTGATIKVKSKKDKISARKGVFRIALIPFAHDQFYAPDNDAVFIFSRDAKGSITNFKANAPDFRNFVFEKKK